MSPICPREELDLRLIRTKGLRDAALEYAKTWSRYVKELLAWTEKRASYGEGFLGPVSGPALTLVYSHLPDSDPCCLPPRAESLPKDYEDCRGWQGVSPAAGSPEQTLAPRAQPSRIPAGPPLDPQHPLTQAVSPLPEPNAIYLPPVSGAMTSA